MYLSLLFDSRPLNETKSSLVSREKKVLQNFCHGIHWVFQAWITLWQGEQRCTLRSGGVVVDLKYSWINNCHMLNNLVGWFRIFLVTLISSLLFSLLPEILVLAVSKAQDTNFACLCFGDKACCTSARNPVTIASLWRLMECLSVLLWPSTSSLNDSSLFTFSARFIPKGKPPHTHTIVSKKKGRMGTEQQSQESCPITSLCDYARVEKEVLNVVLQPKWSFSSSIPSASSESQAVLSYRNLNQLSQIVLVLSLLNCDKISHFSRQKW